MPRNTEKVIIKLTLSQLIELHSLWGDSGIAEIFQAARADADRLIRDAQANGYYARLAKKLQAELAKKAHSAKNK